MTRNVVIFEGATLDEARKKLFTESPRGLFLQSETDIPPRTKTVTAVGNSTEDAFVAALAQQPQGMSITNKKETASARRTTVHVDAWDKEMAEAQMLKQAGVNALLESSMEIEPPKRRLFGLSKTPGKYEGIVFCKASVEVQFTQAARIEATFGARIINWAGLVHHLFSPGVKIIDELGERFGYQMLFILQEQELVPTYYDGIPFTPVSTQTVAKCHSLVNSTRLPGMLGVVGGIVGASLEPNRYEVRDDGQITMKINAMSVTAIVSVASCLPRGNVNMLSDDHGRFALQALHHYSKIPLVRYFLGLSFSHEILSGGPFSPDLKFDGKKYLAQVYSGAEALLLEIYDALPEGGLITDDLVTGTVRGFFEL